jgi:hypothetical protein
MRQMCNQRCQNVRFQASGNVYRVLVLLLRDLGLVVEALVAQRLELFACVLFAFGGGVVVAEGTGEGELLETMSIGCCISMHVLRTYACRPRILLAFSSGLRCSILKDVCRLEWESVDLLEDRCKVEKTIDCNSSR